MIGYVKGTISHIDVDYCFVDVQGVGYRIFITDSTRKKLTLGSIASLFTYLHVREDALLLYGFFSQDEYDMFLHLLSVSGIGPKVALGILSAITPVDFRTALLQKNLTILTKIPGVGRKTAERLILELRDKFGKDDDGTVPTALSSSSAESDKTVDNVLQALLALGYTTTEITPILNHLDHTSHSVEELIKLALKELSRR